MTSHFLRLNTALVALVLVGITANLAATSTTTANATTAAEKLNVLFIAVDDLRPELGCYGSELTRTPNIDKLASRSLTFERAYCQYPVCNPSRSSMLTGMYPDTIKVYDLKKSFRADDKTIISLPQLFKQNGYHTQSIGKIFHATGGLLSDPESWSIPPTAGSDRSPTPDGVRRRSHGLPFEAPDVPDNLLPDGHVAEMAAAALRENAHRPFFLAVGFAKPHLPFQAPKSYWNRYEATSVPMASHPFSPKDSPPFAHNNSGELRQYETIPKGQQPIPEEQQRQLKAGYLACVDYMDAQAGHVLDELDRLGLREKTVVVLWGDHGYQLGEHGTWTKHTLWEDSARVPLLLADPRGAAAGRRSTALVELLDVFPTLAEMCGLQAPVNLEGSSLVPLLKDPRKKWKASAFTMTRKQIPGIGMGVGRSIRTDRYRFVEWSARKPEHRNFKSRELYDLQTDPLVSTNLANDPTQNAVIQELTTQLKSHLH